jgi:hypothetical protein
VPQHSTWKLEKHSEEHSAMQLAEWRQMFNVIWGMKSCSETLLGFIGQLWQCNLKEHLATTEKCKAGTCELSYTAKLFPVNKKYQNIRTK